MARHSIVRSPRCWAGGERNTERGDGSDDGRQRRFSATLAEVVLGVDTHLDLHVAL
jgi:hypothetical protein